MSSDLLIENGGLSPGPRAIAEAARVLTGMFGLRFWNMPGTAGDRVPAAPARGSEVVTLGRARPRGAGREGPRAGRALGETVRLLRETRPPLWPGLVSEPPVSAGPAIPEGARFEARRFTCAEGARDYRLYVPARGAARPRGLILMLHGCKQTPEDFALGTGMNEQAEKEGLILVYPRQVAARNASCCWNWFRGSDQGRGQGEPAILAEMTRSVAGEFGIPPDRVFVAGLSAGGAMAAILGEAYPDVFAAAGIHSGVPTGSASDVASALAAMRGEAAPARRRRGPNGRRIVFQGIEDRTVHPANAARLLPPEIQAAPRSVGRTPEGRVYQRFVLAHGEGPPVNELWLVEASGHAWSGGRAGGSYTDPIGPDASAEMARFFLAGA